MAPKRKGGPPLDATSDDDTGGDAPMIVETVTDEEGYSMPIHYRGIDQALVTGTKEYKKAARLADNRRSAAKSRALAKLHTDAVDRRLAQLVADNARQQREIETLKAALAASSGGNGVAAASAAPPTPSVHTVTPSYTSGARTGGGHRNQTQQRQHQQPGRYSVSSSASVGGSSSVSTSRSDSGGSAASGGVSVHLSSMMASLGAGDTSATARSSSSSSSTSLYAVPASAAASGAVRPTLLPGLGQYDDEYAARPTTTAPMGFLRPTEVNIHSVLFSEEGEAAEASSLATADGSGSGEMPPSPVPSSSSSTAFSERLAPCCNLIDAECGCVDGGSGGDYDGMDAQAEGEMAAVRHSRSYSSGGGGGGGSTSPTQDDVEEAYTAAASALFPLGGLPSGLAHDDHGAASGVGGVRFPSLQSYLHGRATNPFAAASGVHPSQGTAFSAASSAPTPSVARPAVATSAVPSRLGSALAHPHAPTSAAALLGMAFMVALFTLFPSSTPTPAHVLSGAAAGPSAAASSSSFFGGFHGFGWYGGASTGEGEGAAGLGRGPTGGSDGRGGHKFDGADMGPLPQSVLGDKLVDMLDGEDDGDGDEEDEEEEEEDAVGEDTAARGNTSCRPCLPRLPLYQAAATEPEAEGVECTPAVAALAPLPHSRARWRRPRGRLWVGGRGRLDSSAAGGAGAGRRQQR